MKRLDEIDVTGKRVFLRVDLNVPMVDAKISNDRKLQAILSTVRWLKEKKARTLLVSHLGRPKEGVFSEKDSLKPIAERLAMLLGSPIRFEPQWIEGGDIAPGEIVLGENVRFLPGESENDLILTKKMAALCDVFVMDAFPCAHRVHASTVGIAHYASVGCAGPSLCREMEALSRALSKPKRPWIAIVGGAKIGSKFHLLTQLLHQADGLIVGGGMANAFVQEAGYAIGASRVETDGINMARALRLLALKLNKSLIIPIDAVTMPLGRVVDFAESKNRIEGGVGVDEMIADMGPKTLQQCAPLIATANTIVWNGPVGIYEKNPFHQGTQQLAEMIVKSRAISVVGGGETVDALDRFGFIDKISYVSLGGGAFLEYLSGRSLTALAALEEKEINEPWL